MLKRLKRTLSAALSVILSVVIFAGVLTQIACKSSDIDQIIAAANGVRTIFEGEGVGFAHLDDVIRVANDFRNNLQEGGSNAGALVATLINNWGLLTDDAKNIQNKTNRTLALVGLFLGDLALRRLAAKYEQAPTRMRGAPRDGAKIAAFRTKKLWRCRSSQTGRFVEMDYCKKHPDVSVVETY